MNHPKPTALKVLEGNPGKRPLNMREPMPVQGLPRCPSWLKGEGRREWHRVIAYMGQTGVITQIDASMLAVYCREFARYVALDGDISPARIGQMRALASEFGMTPSARVRMVAPLRDNDDNDEKSDFLRRKNA